MSPRNLYRLITAVCLSSYLWIFYAYQNRFSSEVCLFRRFTHLPCPSCGSTRAVLSILKGDLIQAFFLNPMGFLIVPVLLICPFWLLFDFVGRKATLIHFYQTAENFLRRPLIAFLLILLISLNWIWNIIKAI